MLVVFGVIGSIYGYGSILGIYVPSSNPLPMTFPTIKERRNITLFISF